MAMFENQPNRPVGAVGAQPRPMTPPPVRPAPPSREPEDIFAGVEGAGSKMPPSSGMPSVAPKRGGRKIVLVFIIFIIIILLVVGGVLAYLSFMNQAPVTNTNLPVVNINQPANGNANVNANTNANVNVNTNVNQLILPEVTYTTGKDSDLDGLTDTEETLYGTTNDNPDTDGDNYIDGVELIGLFDPTKGNGALLKNSTLVKVFKNATYGFSINYPAKWTAKANDDTEKEVIFQSLGEESIKVSAEENTSKVSLYEWLLSKMPTADLTQYPKTINKGGWDQLVSPDKLTYYLTKEGQLDKVYVIYYALDNNKVADYLSTLQMMVNSFTLNKQQV